MAKKILIVEDDEQMAKLLRRQLDASGYDALNAYTGEAGLKLARSKQAVAYYSHSAGQLSYSCPYIILCLFHSDLRKSSPY